MRVHTCKNEVIIERYRMSLDIDMVDGRGLNNKICHQLQPKKIKVMLY